MPTVRTRVIADLPNFPDDIIDQWIGYYADSDGWPPPDPLAGRWFNLLGGRPLSYWRSLHWELRDLNPVSLPLTAESADSVCQIVRAHTLGERNTYSEFMLAEGKPRFHSIIWHLRTVGKLPRAPIVITVQERFEVMDGNHRLAAYFAWLRWQHEPTFQKPPLPVPLYEECQFWVGAAGA